MPSTQFRTLVADTPSLEKRILQLPFQFFLRADLKQPTMNEYGKRINAPFHHVDGNLLNNILDKLVQQKLLSMGNFISRPKAQQTHSFMKNPIPNDTLKKEQFLQHLEDYKINTNDYINLLARSNLPNKCTILPEAKLLLTTKIEHRDDCIKYNLIFIGISNVANTTDGNLLVELPAVETISNESNSRDQLVDINGSADVLFDKNDDVVTCTSETDIPLNSNHSSSILSDNHRDELLDNSLNMVRVQQPQVTQFFANNNKAIDVQSKEFDQNREQRDCQLIQPVSHIESGTVTAKPSDDYSEDVKACVKSILQYPSIVVSPSDVCLATRRQSAAVRQRSIQLMINENLLHEDKYFIRKLSKSVKMTKGFIKKVPRVNDEQSRFDFIAVLNRFGITWELFISFFDLTKNGFHTTTQLLLNEKAEVLLDSEDYRGYVVYDKCAIFRPIQNTMIEQDELEHGDNVTGNITLK
ncbi:unnamed protein product [Adineta steineri]|uniref:Uncharacterized protein n=1 Tax=Adineta steineri TaxID=433720 RepID=A0A815TI36_9BILA|nr:unnamed protein product [Adineta steineri]